MKYYRKLYRALHDGKAGCRFFTTQQSYSSKTHYEVLGVSSNSTTKEIKTAYLKLCKNLHPDKRPTDINQHKKFVQLNEAYTTLVRPQSREQYDLSLSSQHSHGFQNANNYYGNNKYHYQSPFDERRYGPYEYTRWSNPENIYRKNKYYGVEAEQRQNKFIVVIGCLVLMIVGGFVHYATFTVGTTFSERKLDEKDRIISHAYMKVRQKAIHSKNKEKMSELKDRLVVTSLEAEKVHESEK